MKFLTSAPTKSNKASGHTFLEPRSWQDVLGQIIDHTLKHRISKNIDTQNDGLEKGAPLKKWQFLVSMLDFWGVYTFIKSKLLWSKIKYPSSDIHLSPVERLVAFVSWVQPGCRIQ